MFRSCASLSHINNNVSHINNNVSLVNNNVPHINNNAGLRYYSIVYFLHHLFVLQVCVCVCVSGFVCLRMHACMCGSIQLFTYLDADALCRAT